jgi:hypothetical protein
MWRSAVIGLVIFAACADQAAPPACLIDHPPGECEHGGLAGIDLNGTWTFTGTFTRTVNEPPAPTTTMGDDTHTVTFAVTGCDFAQGELTGTIDDTVATASTFSAPDFRTTNMHVCAVTDGTLRYALASDWNTVGHPGGNYGTETRVGTLSR